MALTLPSQPPVASRLARAIVSASLVLMLAIITTDTTTLQVRLNLQVEVDFMDVYSYRYMLGMIMIGEAYMLLQIADTIYGICSANQLIGRGGGSLMFDFFRDKMVSSFLATDMTASFGATKDLKAMFERSGTNIDKATGLILFSFVCTALLSVKSPFSLPKNI